MYCYHPTKKLKTKLQIVLIIILYIAIVLSPLYQDKVHQFNIDEFIAGFFTEKVIYVDNKEVPKYNPCELDVVVCDGEEKPDLKQVDELKETIKAIFGDKWKLAYAVMMAEGGQAYYRGEKPINYNRNGTVDKGVWQINSIHNVPDSCAYDISCSTEFAYKLSKGGTDWTPWYGFTTGGYLTHLHN